MRVKKNRSIHFAQTGTCELVAVVYLLFHSCEKPLTNFHLYHPFSFSDLEMPPSQRSRSEGSSSSKSPRSSINFMAPSKMSDGGQLKRELPISINTSQTSESSFDSPKPRLRDRSSGKRPSTAIIEGSDQQGSASMEGFKSGSPWALAGSK